MIFNSHNKRGKGIVHVKDLFAKYTKVLRAPQGIVLTAFIHAVEEVCGVSLTKTQCRYDVTKRTITVTASGVIRTEILLKKEDVLRVVGEVIGKENSPTQIL